ncbi:MAG: hypothetical protein DWQ07_11755 [Chloroflexi bacterium]|nr:MAG: hypothetical protein DWQ07_11755 [Chloroflexota bacterium]MBL1197122.1 hypothetical protein [Chloroflexota bacterium]NOH14417.1 hypothetical protein [Chloroflexota bacterium]
MSTEKDIDRVDYRVEENIVPERQLLLWQRVFIFLLIIATLGAIAIAIVLFSQVNSLRDQNDDLQNQISGMMNIDPDLELAWSPDGSRIVFVSERDGDKDIYIYTLEDGKEIALTDNASQDFNPQWSEDGANVIIDSDRSGEVEQYTIIISEFIEEP